MNNFVKTLINRMSRITGTILTEKHYKVLEYTYEYFEKNKVGPLYQNIKKNTNTSREEIEKLFPHGLNSVYTWVGIHIQAMDKSCKPAPTIDVDDYRDVYLDHNATTYPHKKVIKIIKNYYNNELSFGNPSSSTFLGNNAHNLISIARSKIANCLTVDPNEIIFTGGGSEANNLAIKGIAFKHLKNKGHIITNKIEHSSVLNTIKYLHEIGFSVTFIDVDKTGRISPESVEKHLQNNTLLVAIMAANNEIGTINPVKDIGDICKKANVPFLVDAVQAFGRIKISPKEMGISLLSISGHKIYGPKGVGALYVDENINLIPIIHGGGQEFNLRSGTENVGNIIAFGEAARLIHNDMDEENERLFEIRQYFLSELRKVTSDFIINGSLNNRLSNNLNIGFHKIDSSALLLSLNQIGIYVSAGSACSAGSREDSHVLEALGLNTKLYGSIRFSFGLRTNKEDLTYLFKYLPLILSKLTKK